jgi:alanine racemase
MSRLLRDTVLEVDLDCIEYNIKSIKNMVGEGVSVAAVVKANGYGHGARGISEVLIENGAEYLAVAALNEAMEIKRELPMAKVFIMGHTPDHLLQDVVDNDFTQCIFTLEQGEILDSLGKEAGKKPDVHIKYDTGFNRLGFVHGKDSLKEIKKICSLENINVEGIFSHLALTGPEENRVQYEKLTWAVSELAREGIEFEFLHIEDSIAAVDFPQYRLNMIRPGAIIYGIEGFRLNELSLRQALRFKSRLSHVKQVKAGEGVSYDFLWQAEKDSVIGTVPFGYGDGYPRNLRDSGYVVIEGKKAPIVGVICMDQCMVDITHIEEAKSGSECIIYSDGSDGAMTISEAARLSGTNKNDIMSRISLRVPRIYTRSGNVKRVIDYTQELR